jgi:hypothetical protein
MSLERGFAITSMTSIRYRHSGSDDFREDRLPVFESSLMLIVGVQSRERLGRLPAGSL